MLTLIFLLAGSPARAETPHVPVEMQQKYEDISSALRESYLEAQRKLHNAEDHSDLLHAALNDIAGLWAKAKAKGRSGIIYLDHQLHEHVIGAEEAPKGK